MDKTFFGNQVDRMRGVYSPAALNEERVSLWWKQFKDVPNHVFESALNHIIGEATTQALPAMSKIAEAIGFFRTNPSGASMQILAPAHDCEVCRDFGYTFSGDVVVRCPTCYRGREIGPEALAHAQGCFDRGKRFLANPRKPGTALLPSLPYDPHERIDREAW